MIQTTNNINVGSENYSSMKAKVPSSNLGEANQKFESTYI